MHLENHHSKHRDDLLALLEHSASISAEMSLDQLVGSISALDLAKYVNTNLRGSTR